MARKKNTEERERISKIAYKLFSENGYNKTLISRIAAESGVEKSLVQHYFPKKEIFITDLLKKNFETITRCVEADNSNDGDVIIRLYRIGYLHFDFLLNNERMKLITKDIVENRTLTANAILTEIEWASDYMKNGDFEKTADNIAAAMGGAYELVYKYMAAQRQLSVRYLVEKTYLIFAVCQGKGREEALSELEKFKVSPEWVEKMSEKISGLMF